MPSAAHFASLTLPETGRATGRCSLRESTIAEEATEYFGGGGRAEDAASAWLSVLCL
jgi:hypothetical protein